MTPSAASMSRAHLCDPDPAFSDLVKRIVRGEGTDAELAMLLSPPVVSRYRDALTSMKKSIEAQDIAWRSRVTEHDLYSAEHKQAVRERHAWQARVAPVRQGIMERQRQLKDVLRSERSDISADVDDLLWQRVKRLEDEVAELRRMVEVRS